MHNNNISSIWNSSHVSYENIQINSFAMRMKFNAKSFLSSNFIFWEDDGKSNSSQQYNNPWNICQKYLCVCVCVRWRGSRRWECDAHNNIEMEWTYHNNNNNNNSLSFKCALRSFRMYNNCNFFLVHSHEEASGYGNESERRRRREVEELFELACLTWAQCSVIMVGSYYAAEKEWSAPHEGQRRDQ